MQDTVYKTLSKPFYLIIHCISYMDKTFLCVFGHAAIDVILQISKLPNANMSVPVEDRKVRYGGTGANIAKAASDMGVASKLISFVGDDFPEDYEQRLRMSGVDLSSLFKVEGQRTPTCWIATDTKENQMAFIDQGAMDAAEENGISENILKHCDMVHIGTGRPGYYDKVITKANELNIPVGFDPAQELKYVYEPETFIRFLKRCSMFFCNQSEFEVALKYVGGSSSDDLLEHVDTVIKTTGKRGSVLYTLDAITQIPSFEPSMIVDPTGAGDAYRAGFYGGLRRGWGLEKCCLAGSSRASFTLEYYGPQEGFVSWEEVVRRMKEDEGN